MTGFGALLTLTGWRTGPPRTAGPSTAAPLADGHRRPRLTQTQLAILRDGATEEPFSSPLAYEERVGHYDCARCGSTVYRAADKYDSGTGWPAFVQPADPEAIRRSPEPKLEDVSQQVTCARCGGHLGRVYDDGPPPTGRRHCINGHALVFIATDA
ncbi:peptide-methionine (R)-S-oxide reductase [Jannaschia aquimarina]|uniref:peptide-methionine (R)-S-oxide reductase n=1 Tax=Jannaschia aquimarina TaxID=935700 RepID=UPI0013791CB6|nr:peptide-methionine (R)-S-oxide reductase [Jannaschia aquimarina]